MTKTPTAIAISMWKYSGCLIALSRNPIAKRIADRETDSRKAMEFSRWMKEFLRRVADNSRTTNISRGFSRCRSRCERHRITD